MNLPFFLPNYIAQNLDVSFPECSMPCIATCAVCNVTGMTDPAAAAEAGPGSAAAFTPGPVEAGWEIWFGAVVGVVPFAIGAYEFGKRIVSAPIPQQTVAIKLQLAPAPCKPGTSHPGISHFFCTSVYRRLMTVPRFNSFVTSLARSCICQTDLLHLNCQMLFSFRV